MKGFYQQAHTQLVWKLFFFSIFINSQLKCGETALTIMVCLHFKLREIILWISQIYLSYLPFLNAFNIGTYVDEKELSSDWLIDERTTMDTNICIYNTVIHSVYQLMKKIRQVGNVNENSVHN